MGRITLGVVTCIGLAACGGNDTPAVDAPASGATVQAITCPATPAATIMTSGSAYSPMSVTITQGQVVKFVMPSVHNVVPNATGSDPGLMVNFSETKCLMFTQTGTFGFHCQPHGFTGSVVVQ